MTQRTTGREMIWMLTGMVLLFNCGCCIAYLLNISAFLLVGGVLGVVGFGIGLGVSMHLEHVLWNLKKETEHDPAVWQLINKITMREICVIIGIWVLSPIMHYATLVLLIALSGESIE